MDNTPEEVEDQITDLQLAKQDAGTVEILKQDVIDDLKSKLELVKSFKRKYTLKKLAVTDIESKEQKEKLRLALAELRTTRTGLKDDRISKTKPYRDTVAYINENYDAVIEVIEGMEAPLIEHNKQVKLEIEKKAKEEEERKKKLVIERVKKCQDAGMVFDGEYYSIGSEEFGVDQMSLGMVEFETMTEPIFENIFQQIEEKAKIIADAAEAKKQRLAAEKLQKEEEDRKAKQKLLDDQAEVAAKQKALDDAEKLQKEKAANLAAKIFKMRLYELASLGIQYDSSTAFSSYKGSMIFSNKISEIEDKEWDVLIGETFPKRIKEKEDAIKEKEDAMELFACARAARQKVIDDAAQKVIDDAFKIPLEGVTVPVDVVEPQKPTREWGNSSAAFGPTLLEADEKSFSEYQAAILMVEYPVVYTAKYKDLLIVTRQKIAEIMNIKMIY